MGNYRGRSLLWLAGLTLLLVLGWSRPSFSQLPGAELRGVWLTTVDSEVLFDGDRLGRALQQLSRLNFNTIYPAVWNWGYTLHPSDRALAEIGYAVDPRVPSLADRDALADVVVQGHELGLAVMPWFEFGFMTTAESELVRNHPNWITTRRNGSIEWQDGRYQRAWLNPFLPEVQQFIQDLVLEIVDRYAIDGIQFDDHMGLPAEFGYDAYTVQLYRQEHQGQPPPSDPNNPAWVRWRADKITAFMGRLFQAIKAQKPNIIVSLSPNPYHFAYSQHLQDWRTWVQRGYVEELIIQAYADRLSDYAATLDSEAVQAARRHIPTAVGILTGLKDQPVPIAQVQRRVQMAREQQFVGVSFFFYETLWNLTAEPEADRMGVFEQLFSRSASRPLRELPPVPITGQPATQTVTGQPVTGQPVTGQPVSTARPS